MKTTTLEIGGLIEILDYLAVEKRLKALPNVAKVVMNPAGDTATVTYDENHTDVAALVSEVEACAFHCRGESVPRHICVPDSAVAPPGHPRAPSAAHAEPVPRSVAKTARTSPADAVQAPCRSRSGA